MPAAQSFVNEAEKIDQYGGQIGMAAALVVLAGYDGNTLGAYWFAGKIKNRAMGYTLASLFFHSLRQAIIDQP